MRCIKGGLVGGIILFIWGAVSWMFLPWHIDSFHNFKDDAAVVKVIQENASQSGIYTSPAMGSSKEKFTGPFIFSSVHHEPMEANMTVPMIYALICQVIAAFFVAWILTKTATSYFGRLGIVILFALSAGLVCFGPYWIWFKFDTHYILTEFADLIVGWFLAGLVLAKIARPQRG